MLLFWASLCQVALGQVSLCRVSQRCYTLLAKVCFWNNFRSIFIQPFLKVSFDSFKWCIEKVAALLAPQHQIEGTHCHSKWKVMSVCLSVGNALKLSWTCKNTGIYTLLICLCQDVCLSPFLVSYIFFYFSLSPFLPFSLSPFLPLSLSPFLPFSLSPYIPFTKSHLKT